MQESVLDLQKLIQLKAKLIKKETAFLYVLYLFNVKLKFIYSEKATKFCEIFPLLLTAVHTVKSKGKVSQIFLAFSEYMNFTAKLWASEPTIF